MSFTKQQCAVIAIFILIIISLCSCHLAGAEYSADMFSIHVDFEEKIYSVGDTITFDVTLKKESGKRLLPMDRKETQCYRCN